MLLSPENTQLIGQDLDHPECLCLAPDGSLFAGGEAGQIYHIDVRGGQRLVGSTGGFILGIALDGRGRIHACDARNKGVFLIEPDGNVALRSAGTKEHPMTLPNYPAFDVYGNLFVSDSGDYWDRNEGTGRILKIAPDNTTTVFHSGPFLFANGLAIDPTQRWLYVVQTTADNVARIPLDEPNGPIEIVFRLPSETVPDGIAFASNGSLVISCYKPDTVFLGHPDGRIEVLCDDRSGELLNRPTNSAIGNGKLYLANVGGWHLTAIASELKAAVIHRPHLA